MLEERIQRELDLLKPRFTVEYVEEGRWVRIGAYPLAPGWNRTNTDVAFQIPVGYPATPPYGIYVPIGITFNSQIPKNYTEPASNHPPFVGTWGIFSWQEEQWRSADDITSGSNMMTWVLGFTERFEEGQ